MKAHPGFHAAAKSVASKEHLSQAAAGAIIASASRNASPEAKKKNPKLLKVKSKK